MDVVGPVDFTRKGIDFLVHFVHKVHDVQRIAYRIRSWLANPGSFVYVASIVTHYTRSENGDCHAGSGTVYAADGMI